MSFQGRISGFSIYGDGTLGDVSINTTTTLTGDVYYKNLTLGASCILNTACFKIHVQNKLTMSSGAIIQNNGGAGAVSGTAGAAVTVQTCGTGSAGGAGGTGAGSAGAANTAALGSAGGAGGAGSGGAGGAAGSNTPNVAASGGTDINRAMPYASLGIGAGSNTKWTGGSGGGGGGGDGTAGGGGGAGAGVIIICARIITGTGLIQAVGGAGGSPIAGNRGGGGGGGGGNITIITDTPAQPIGITLTVTGGLRGIKTGTGANGTNGTTGSTRWLANKLAG